MVAMLVVAVMMAVPGPALAAAAILVSLGTTTAAVRPTSEYGHDLHD